MHQQNSITSYFNKISENNPKECRKPSLLIYTDGSCINNGKQNAKAGIGIYCKEADLYISKRITGKQTNQRAELSAILIALENITISVYDKITIYTDSMYSINCLTQWIKNWIKNNWLDKHKKPIKNKDLILSIYNIICLNPRIYLLHIEAHTNKKDIHSIGNSIADKLARDSILN